MRLASIWGLCAIVTWGLLLPVMAAEHPKHNMAFWQKNYEQLRRQDDPRAERAHNIFKSLLQVAGSLPGVEPQLYITKNDDWGVPFAIAIRKGGVIVSKGVLDFCY